MLMNSMRVGHERILLFNCTINLHSNKQVKQLRNPEETKSIFNNSLSKSLYTLWNQLKSKITKMFQTAWWRVLRYTHQFPRNLLNCFIFQINHFIRETKHCKSWRYAISKPSYITNHEHIKRWSWEVHQASIYPAPSRCLKNVIS